MKFLQNPKVLQTPSEHKRLFLIKKGLTESEIKSAFQQAGVIETQPQSNHNLTANTSISNSLLIKKETRWQKIFRWIRNLIIAGCFAYTAYKTLIQVFKQDQICLKQLLSDFKS